LLHLFRMERGAGSEGKHSRARVPLFVRLHPPCYLLSVVYLSRRVSPLRERSRTKDPTTSTCAQKSSARKMLSRIRGGTRSAKAKNPIRSLPKQAHPHRPEHEKPATLLLRLAPKGSRCAPMSPATAAAACFAAGQCLSVSSDYWWSSRRRRVANHTTEHIFSSGRPCTFGTPFIRVRQRRRRKCRSHIW